MAQSATDALMSGDPDWVDLYAEDVVRIDRRGPLRMPDAVGHEAYRAALDGVLEVGLRDISFEPLAVRGDRFAIIDGRAASESENELRILSVMALDDEGHISRVVLFDPTDMKLAFEELCELAGDSEAEEGSPIDLHHRAIAAMNSESWEELLRLLHPDFKSIDHRPLGWEELDGQGWVERTRGLFDVVTDVVVWSPALHRTNHAGLLASAVTTARDASGGHVRWEVLALNVVRDGALERVEYFSAQDWQLAQGRFAALT